MKKLIVAALFAVGCASASNDNDLDNNSDVSADAGSQTGGVIDRDDLGQTKQSFLAYNGPTRQWGTCSSCANKTSCTTTTNNQTCTFARYKKIEIARTPGSWSAAQLAKFDEVRGNLAAWHPTWTFTVVNSSSSPASGFVRIVFGKSTTADPLPLNNVIETYRTVSFVSPVALTEGQHPGMLMPKGNYQYHGSCTANIKTTNIDNKVSSAPDRIRLFDHAVGNAIVVCMGVGTRNDEPDTFSQRAIMPQTLPIGATLGERCRADYGDNNDALDFSINPDPTFFCAD